MKKTVSLLMVFVCIVLLCGCTKKVEFSSDKIPEDSTELTITLQPGETEKLDMLPALSFADLRGSENYEEISAWAETHPNVEVLWSVPMPDGSSVDSSTTSLDMSAFKTSDYKKVVELIEFLPELEELSFENALSPEDLNLFCSAYPELKYDCNIKLGGKTFSVDSKTLDFTGADDKIAAELALVLPAMKELGSVELGSEESSPDLSWESIAELQKAQPEADFIYAFTLYDLPCTTLDKEMNINHIRIYDEGELVRKAISMMPELELLDMDTCHVSNESMAAIRDDFPDVKVVWRIWFGTNYTARTDVEKILASMVSIGGSLTERNTEALKYCTEIKYLDIGHNEELESIEFVRYMPNLEVLIVSISGLKDITPLEDCPKLEFLEIQTSFVKDISVLSQMKDLKHLNICLLHELTDLSPIYDIDLERLWIGRVTPIPEEQIEKFKELHPDCDVNTTTYDPHEGEWRYVWDSEKNTGGGFHPRYALLVEQFGYDRADYAFPWKDPLY